MAWQCTGVMWQIAPEIFEVERHTPQPFLERPEAFEAMRERDKDQDAEPDDGQIVDDEGVNYLLHKIRSSEKGFPTPPFS